MSRVYLIFVLVLFKNVNLMSLDGPVLTRYDPCGLGIVHFDRVNETYWRGAIHFGLYSKLHEVEARVYFEKPVVVYTSRSYKNFAARRETFNDLIVNHIAPIQHSYMFELSVGENRRNDVPIVSKFILNNVTLCSDDIKVLQKDHNRPLRMLTLFKAPIKKELPTLKTGGITQVFANNTQVHTCGRRYLNHTELVSTRTEAKAGDWPWHVAMMIRNQLTNVPEYDCGGNIISMKAVLTAGHCIFKHGKLLEPYRVIVIAGTNNYKDPHQVGRQMLGANRLILHPAYNDDYATSDLGIITVDRFVYSEFVQPICIWGPAYDKTNLFGMEATIVGFGSKEDGQQSDILRSSTTMVQPDSTCVNFMSNVYSSLMDEFTFCAGYGPTSTINPRNGDSGGGLVVSTLQPDHRISWFLRGVLSKCGVAPGGVSCDPTYYVVYTDVGPHYGWIHHNSGLEFRINVHD